MKKVKKGKKERLTETDYKIDLIANMVQLVKVQKETNAIEGVIYNENGQIITESFKQVVNWVYQSKVSGGKNKTIQIFFNIKTKMTMRELVLDQLDICKEFNTRVILKTISCEHTSRTRLIYEISVNYLSPTYYEYEIY